MEVLRHSLKMQLSSVISQGLIKMETLKELQESVFQLRLEAQKNNHTNTESVLYEVEIMIFKLMDKEEVK